MINISVRGAEIIKAKISRFVEHIKDWRPLYDIFREEFHAIMREQFASEGKHGGEEWKPLTKNYAKWKEKVGMGRSILVLYGNLYSSLVKSGDPYEVFRTEKDNMTIGTSRPTGYWHHFGRGRNPERKIIKFSKEDNTRWVKLAQEWMVVQLRSGK